MKKILLTMGLVAFAFVGCDDSSSASAGQDDEAVWNCPLRAETRLVSLPKQPK